jgi:hypothetical protein
MFPPRIGAPAFGCALLILTALNGAETTRADQAAVAPATVKPHATASTNVARPLTEEQRALLAVEQDAQRQVADLTQLMKVTPDGARQADLARRVEQVKTDLRVQLLRTRLAFATRRGDLPAAQRIQAMIENQLKPAAKPAAQHLVQNPDKTVSQEGGRP